MAGCRYSDVILKLAWYLYPVTVVSQLSHVKSLASPRRGSWMAAGHETIWTKVQARKLFVFRYFRFGILIWKDKVEGYGLYVVDIRNRIVHMYIM